MNTDIKALLRAVLGNWIVAFGYASTAATFIPTLATVRRYLWLLSGALLVIGFFRGALKVIAAKNKDIEEIERSHGVEIEQLRREIEELQRRIIELQRDPFDESVQAKVKSELMKFDNDERAILKSLLQFEPWDYNKLMPGLEFGLQQQTDLLRKGYGAGLLVTEDILLGGIKKAHYKARPQYREALKKYLYEEPRGLQKLARNSNPK